MELQILRSDGQWVNINNLLIQQKVVTYKQGDLSVSRVYKIKSVASTDTYKIYNRYTNFTGYYNQAGDIPAYNPELQSYYQISCRNVFDSLENGTISAETPLSVANLATSIQNRAFENSQIDTDSLFTAVKNRALGIEHFAITGEQATSLLRTWKDKYSKLNGLDWNQASILQAIANKAGYNSILQQDQGFTVVPFDSLYYQMTDYDVSNDIKVERLLLAADNTQIHPICRYITKDAIGTFIG